MKYRSALVLPKLVALFLVIQLFVNRESKAQVLINEVVASNSQGVLDEDGDRPDWIELYNSSENTISLQGYGISDDPEDPFKYVLADYEIPANQFYLLFASDKNRGSNTENEPRFWETVIRQGDGAKYIIPNSAVSSSWIDADFDDSSWQDGAFGFGYGDDDDQTIVPNGTISVFTRATFTIDDASLINDLLLHIDFDDGYVAYLNGVEISRFNLEGSSPLPFNAQTPDYISDPWLVRGEELPVIELDEFKDLIVTGENVLAIQVHNTDAQSSDMSLIPFLTVSRSEEPSESRGVAEEITIEAPGLAYPHLNFKLSSEGETIYLTSPDSVLMDEFSYPFLKSDESYGRSFENNTTFYIFTSPTPLALNNTEGFQERLENPELSLQGGFYQNSIELSVQGSSSGDIVYYTTDGSNPTSNSQIFGTNTRTVSETSTYKFASIESGKLPSEIVTHTYIIGETHDLPIISVSTHPDNLWSDESGIYVRGTNGVSGNCENGPVNWNQDWEIPVHIELYEKNGELGFSSGAGAKIFGGCSRQNPAKSLSIFFRGEYGNSELNYKLFEAKDIETFQAFVLRNSGNDFISQNGTMLRDALMITLIENTVQDYQAYRPTVMYLNGEYWGIHNIREKINEHFIASNSNSNADEIDLLEGQGSVIHGTGNFYSEFLSAMRSANMSNEEEYLVVENMIDIDNYIDYMASEIYYSNDDWPGNNIKYWRDRAESGKWRWIIYDTDFGFNLYGDNYTDNTLDFALATNGPDWPNPPWSTEIFRNFVQSEIFVDKFITRMSDLMNTSFEREYVNSVIDSLSSKIASEIPRHTERWGSSVSSWEDRINNLKVFAENRPSNMETFLMNRFGVLSPSNITVDTSDENHGIVKVNRVVPDSFPWQGRYFRGIPVQITAIPKRGYEFTGWSDDARVTSPSRQVLASTTTYTANFAPIEGEIRDIVINEIMYNAADEQDSGDWIELFNSAEYDVDLSNWVIKDEDNSHEFIFPDNTMLAAGTYLVVAADLTAFNAQHTLNTGLFGDLGYNLAGGSDQVRLYDSYGVLIDSLHYQDSDPWDSNADGTGFTLELKDAAMDNSLAESWAASTQSGGTPGSLNTMLVSIEEPENLPSNITLFQNYPNPFNPATNIAFQLPEQAKTNISVYDMLGRKVSVLVDDVRSAGSHTVAWDASKVSSGVYFYRLQVSSDVLTRKMLLIK